jgi:hypothetical protein
MRKRLAILATMSSMLSGCIQLEMLLKVKKDGTGSFVETVLFDVSMLEDFMKRLPKEATASTRPWDINEAELKAAAEKKGKGVKFVSATPATRGKFKGYTATYSFDDVTQVSIDPDPAKRAPKAPNQPQQEHSDPMRFKFKKGRTSELTVRIPHEEVKKDKAKGEDKKVDPNDESFEMMRTFLTDMRVKIQMEVDGKVESSNAKFRDGNTITVLDLDFNALLGDTQRLADVMNADSYNDAAIAFNTVPGMKVETQKEVRVAFK